MTNCAESDFGAGSVKLQASLSLSKNAHNHTNKYGVPRTNTEKSCRCCKCYCLQVRGHDDEQFLDVLVMAIGSLVNARLVVRDVCEQSQRGHVELQGWSCGVCNCIPQACPSLVAWPIQASGAQLTKKKGEG